MLRNYFITAFRNLIRQKGFTLINLIGLIVGMSSTILIYLWVNNELSYDRHIDEVENVYRLTNYFAMGGNEGHGTNMPAPMGPTLKEELPYIEAYNRFRTTGGIFRYKDQGFTEEAVTYSDSSFFDVFRIKLIAGDESKSLRRPQTLILSKSTAKKYFGDEDPIGKTLIFDKSTNYEITGVFDDIPDNTHFHFDFILAMAGYDPEWKDSWLSNNYFTYLRLAPNTDINLFREQLKKIADKHTNVEIKQFFGKSLEELREEGTIIEYDIQAIVDIHLHSDFGGELGNNGSVKTVIIFVSIAVFILIIACINFINLSTARFSKRSREVGVRKTIGAQRSQLIPQFFGESLLLSILALNFSLVIIQHLLPYFNELVNKSIQIPWTSPSFILILIGITFLTGILAGFYPALILSSFNPVAVLKGTYNSGKTKSLSRSALVIFQFTISVILIIGTATIYKQMKFIQNKELGYEKEQILIIHNAYVLGSKLDILKEECLKNPNFVSATKTGYLPTYSYRSSSGTFPNRNPDDETMTPIQNWNVDYDYIQTLGIKIVEGRNFSREFGGDSAACIINQAAVKQYQFKNPLGKELSRYKDASSLEHFKVIGVCEDFHFENMEAKIGPVMMILRPSSGKLSFKLRTENIKESVAFLEAKWKEFGPHLPLYYRFMDDDFAFVFSSEAKLVKLIGIFSLLAIFVACLGLFGLATFTVEQRTKEIGIRKSLGSSSLSVLNLLNRTFLKWVAISILISSPIAYFILNEWLNGFAYKTELDQSIFLFSGGIAVFIALVTVSTKVLKAANQNPVKSLRYE